jgi:hypothetical protein
MFLGHSKRRKEEEECCIDRTHSFVELAAQYFYRAFDLFLI